MSVPAPSLVANGLVDWAARTPERVALHDRERALTFEEAAGLAGTCARMLVEHTGERRPDEPVIPLIVQRDVAGIVALLGAFYAGVPFAPIDAALPPAAVAELLARLGGPPLAVLTHPDQRRLVPTGTHPVPVPNHVRDPIAPQPVRPEDRSMVVFTSGSTGRPKGVVLDWWLHDARMGSPRREQRPPGTHLPNLAPVHWTAGIASAIDLATGASVGIIDPSRLDPLALLEELDRQQFARIALVPSLATQVLDLWPEGRRLESVTVVETYGEALTWEHVPGLRRLVSRDASIRAAYAASETVGGVFALEIRAEDPLGTGRVPLGRPRDPGRVRLEPTGDRADEAREIVVRGLVAKEYLGDPELTARRFGVDADGTRWWRSGDLAREGRDGQLRLVGRIDDMVKIRGTLVEPAEPERVLHAISGIRQAVVLPHRTSGGATRLVAHLELDAGSTLTPSEVMARLRAELAPHLVPRPLVRHDHLPLLATGKVDRMVLRDVPTEPWTVAPPRRVHDDVERAVAATAGEILELDGVHPDDDLWELGLDSLGAIELTVACSELGWGTLEPTAPLDHPTPAALAAALRVGALARASLAVTLNPEGARPPLFFVPGWGGTALAFHWVARALGDDQPVIVIEARGLHTPGAPDRTVDAGAARVAGEIDAAQPTGEVVVAGHSAGGVVAVEAARLLADRGRTVAVVLLDTPAPIPGGGRSRRERLREHLAGRRAVDVWRAALRRAHAELLALHPGNPERVTTARYRAFDLLAVRALRRHTTRPVDIPVTILHTGDLAHPDRWRALAPDLSIRPIAGGHLSMFVPPYADGLAACLAAVLGASPGA
ncbi:MAG TPA: non-ribosomal peptide synthetase [Acidimicrobiia bacterium]|nr:non-ribosomal peptide synthetase [Acidimicrobiia bacterium]